MASEEDEPIFTPPRLLLMQKPHGHMQSPERSGTLTPPLHTSASVPFRWEEEPGKPRECTALIPRPINFPQKCLELPPRLLVDTNIPKLPSPTTVLECPYMGKSSRFQSSSFRIIRSRECYGSFRSSCPDRGQFGTPVPSKNRVKEKGGFLGSWRWGRRGSKGKRESGGGSYVFPSSVDREPADHCIDEEEEEEMISGSENVKMTRSGSLSAVSNARPQFWANIYEGLKQVVPWRSKELKKNQGLVI
ncbi:DUF688 domain-containing protein [Salix suchowensis]|nr:DUF688 domain-containing protein [Salix suchowensis]